MSNAKFKTMRHIETVRNYLNAVVRELLKRSEKHDQSKLGYPEVQIFEEYTPKLRDCTYGSDKYRAFLLEMRPALEHHNAVNRHHPEYFKDGINGMNLIDLLEMLCDWKAASMRHSDGDIRRSLEINAERFKYGPELQRLLSNTIDFLESEQVYHHADES